MKIRKQKNIFFINLKEETYKGYVETYLQLENDDMLDYNFSALDILDVVLYSEDGSSFHPDVNIDYLKDSITTNFSRDLPKSDILNICIPEHFRSSDIKIKIEYQMGQFNTFLKFYRPVSEDDKHKEILAFNKLGNSFGIFPSLDYEDPYEFDLIYILPSSEEYKIVSPGLLTNFIERDKVLIYAYNISSTIPGFINFAIGTYERFEILSGDDSKIIFLPFKHEEYKECVSEVIEDFSNILKYVEYFLQRPYPLKNLNVLFSLIDIDDIYGLSTAFCNISRLSYSKDIEPMFLLKRVISNIIASQIFYFYIYPKSIIDHWIFCGMKGYLEDYCVRFLLGNNEFLYQLKCDKDYVFDNDVYELPLCDDRRDKLSYLSKFFQTKSKLVFHTMESNLSKAFLEKICFYTLKRKNEIQKNFTPEFIHLIKDITGKDLKQFFDKYVFKSGLICLNLKFNIDKKKNKVDFKIDQIHTSKLENANKTMSGFITVKSYEIEGSFEHTFNLLQNNHFYYHTRTKKKKKPEEDEEEVMPLLWIRIDPKREHLIKGTVEQPDYMFIEQVLDKSIIGQLESLDYLSKRPSTQVCEALERVLENSHVFYKIRIRILYILSRINLENYFGFQRLIQFFIKRYCVQSSTIIKPNDFNYINYFIQKHTIKALSLTDPFVYKEYNGRVVGSASIISAFILNVLRFNDNSANSFNDSWYVASIIEDLSHPIAALKFSSYEATIDLYNKNECKEVFSAQKMVIDEKDLKVEDDIGGSEKSFENKNEILSYSPKEDSSDDLDNIFKDNEEEVEDLDIKSNDNNELADREKKVSYVKIALDEIERYRLLDMVFPSHKNLVTKAALHFLGRLALHGLIGLKKDVLLELTKFPNSFSVRSASLKILILLFSDDNFVNNYLFEILRSNEEKLKYKILDTWINILSFRLLKIENVLLERKKDFSEILKMYPYNPILIDKVYTIILFLDKKDVSRDEYNSNIVKMYRETQDDFFYHQIMGTNSGCIENRPLSLKIKNLVELKRELLDESFVLRIPIVSVPVNKESSEKQRDYDENNEKRAHRDVLKFIKLNKDESGIIDFDKNEESKRVKLNESNTLEDFSKNVNNESFKDKKNVCIEEINVKEMFGTDAATEELLLKSSELNKLAKKKFEESLLERRTKIEASLTSSMTSSELITRNTTLKEFSKTFYDSVNENNEVKSYNQSQGNDNFTSSLDTSTFMFDDSSIKATNITIHRLFNDFKKIVDKNAVIEEKIMSNDTVLDTNKNSSSIISLNEMDKPINCDVPIKDSLVESGDNFDLDKAIDDFCKDKDIEKGGVQPIDLDTLLSCESEESHIEKEEKIVKTLEIVPEDGSIKNNIWKDYKSINEQNSYQLTSHNPSNTLDIEEFLEGGYDIMPPIDFMRETIENNKSVLSFKISPFIMRLKIGFKIRLPCPPLIKKNERAFSTEKHKKRAYKKKSNKISISKDSKRIKYSYSSYKTRKIYEDTVKQISVKQVNKLIQKNKNNSFFSWRPKTLEDIETYVVNEVKFSKVVRELEKSLVFTLSYSQFNSRTYNIGKKLFDNFERVYFELYSIPETVTPFNSFLRDACIDFLNNLFLDDAFSAFIKPVNTETLNTYIDIVRSPMCLEIIQKKMMMYQTLESFYGDLKQIYKNCYNFNQNSSEICHNAKKMMKQLHEFDKPLEKYKKSKSSFEILGMLLSKFSGSSVYQEIMYKINNRSYKSFYSLFEDIEKIKKHYMKIVISNKQIHLDIEDFKVQVYYIFNVIEGKILSFGL